MPSRPKKLVQIWQELKRRRVVHVIIVYATAAFVIIELVGNVYETLKLPDWTPALTLIMLAIGFPIALIFSWIFDVTPEGIEKTRPSKEVGKEERSSVPNSWRIATYVSGVIIIGLLAYNIFGRRSGSRFDGSLEKSIAVLPFDNMGSDEEYSHLGVAFTDEIIMELQKIKAFDRVLSRTSTMQYAEERPTIPEIGEKLNVNYIIEGFIQRHKDNVSINVQVIRAQHEDHVWGGEYDAKWEDIFSIQDEIAMKVADELKTILTFDEIEKINKVPTNNLEAYDYYLRGNDYYWRSLEEHNWNIAINMYNKAIDLDANFALPYTRLALSYLNLFWFHYDRSQDPIIHSKKAIDAAFSLHPDFPEAYIALGVYYYYGFMNYSEALKYLNIALEQRPTDSELLYYIACVHRRLGNWEKAKEGFKKALENDPNSSRIANNAGDTYVLMREYPDALYHYNKAISLNPDFYLTYMQKVFLFLKRDGNTELARETLEEVSLITNSTLDPQFIEFRTLFDIYDGYYQQALDYLSTADYDINRSQLYFMPRTLINAWIYDLMNHKEEAYAYYNSARIELEAWLIELPDDSRIYSSLGIAYAGLGQRQKAIDAGTEAVNIMPISKDAWRGANRLADLALIYVMVGEYDFAIKHIELLLSIPSVLSTPLLRLDPIWRPLMDHPEFNSLLEMYSAN